MKIFPNIVNYVKSLDTKSLIAKLWKRKKKVEAEAGKTDNIKTLSDENKAEGFDKNEA